LPLVDFILASFSAEITYRVSPIPVDLVVFTLRPDPADTFKPGPIDSIVPAFLLHSTQEVRPALVNVVVASLLLDVANKLS
jgi:hypothetical protein